MTISILETWLAIASGYSSTVVAANMMILRGWSQIISGDFQTGLPLLRDGVSRLRATGSKFQVAYRLGRAVEALRKAGETEEESSQRQIIWLVFRSTSQRQTSQ
jgi:hypothetical protein